MKLDFNEQIEIPEGVKVKVENGTISAKGPKGEVTKKMMGPKIKIEVKDNKVVLSSEKGTKREKRMIGTFKSHINNILQGVINNYTYTLKVCSTHFPMTAAVKDGIFEVQNFLGEKVPRKFKIKEGVDVKVEGDQVIVQSADKELAGITAGRIEQLCRITNRDRRIFQDGIYILSKAEQEKQE